MTTPLLYLRSCPRCHTGDLEHIRDAYGPEVRCLQCGYRVEDHARIKEETERRTQMYRGETQKW